MLVGWHRYVHMVVLAHVPGCAATSQYRGTSPVVLNFLWGYSEIACVNKAPQCTKVCVFWGKEGCEVQVQLYCLLGTQTSAAPATQH